MRTRIVIVIACLLAASIAVARADRAEETPLRMSFSLFPMELGEWQGTQRPPFSDEVLKVLGVDDYLTRLYRRGDRRSLTACWLLKSSGRATRFTLRRTACPARGGGPSRREWPTSRRARGR
jgi:hypothetical protein